MTGTEKILRAAAPSPMSLEEITRAVYGHPTPAKRAAVRIQLSMLKRKLAVYPRRYGLRSEPETKGPTR